MKKIAMRPSKPVAFLGSLGGLCLSIFGLLYAIPNLGVFGIIWTIIAFLITLYYAINLFTKNGLALYKADIEEKEKKTNKKQSFFICFNMKKIGIIVRSFEENGKWIVGCRKDVLDVLEDYSVNIILIPIYFSFE